MQQKMISLWYLVKYIGQCGGEYMFEVNNDFIDAKLA